MFRKTSCLNLAVCFETTLYISFCWYYLFAHGVFYADHSYRRISGTIPTRHEGDTDALPGLALRNDTCVKIDVRVYAAQRGVRKDIVHWLCRSGFKHGFVKRSSNEIVDVVIVHPSGPPIDLSVLSMYFGANWGVTAEFFTVDRECHESAMVQLLRKSFVLLKSNIPDHESRSDENFDCYSSDNGGWEIRSEGSIGNW